VIIPRKPQVELCKAGFVTRNVVKGQHDEDSNQAMIEEGDAIMMIDDDDEVAKDEEPKKDSTEVESKAMSQRDEKTDGIQASMEKP